MLGNKLKTTLEEVGRIDPFIKDLYKHMRNRAKKLEQISKIEEKLKAKQAITDE